MKWEMNHRGDLRLVAATSAEREHADRGTREMCSARHEQAVTTGARLRQVLVDNWLPWDTLRSLSRWCYTEGAHKSGIVGAQRISRAFFDGRILPRLATDEWRRPINTQLARDTMRGFLEDLQHTSAECPSASPDAPAAANSISAPGSPVSSTEPLARMETGSPAGWGRGRGSGGPATHGSCLCLRRWIEVAPDEFAARTIASSVSLALSDLANLEWKSPLSAAGYYEYRDDFLKPLALERHAGEVRRFWPATGPQWDALALLHLRAGRGVLLVEAKAHPAESRSNCAARDPASIAQIDAALGKVQRFMGAEGADWKTGAYQLANRLAFLYLLNEELQIPTWLALVHFVEDRSHRPTSLSEWVRVAAEPFRTLGLRPDSPLLEKVILSFVPACPEER